jgi:hypothetical protein
VNGKVLRKKETWPVGETKTWVLVVVNEYVEEGGF